LDDARDEELRRISDGAPTAVVNSSRAGTIQAVDLKGLLAVAERTGGLVVLARAVGDFVPEGSPLIYLFGEEPATSEKRLGGLIAIGDERTIDQDPAFALRILVDIALMALSPAVNAPTTAVQALDYVEEFLQRVGERELQELGILRDGSGQGGVVIPRRTWGEYLALGVTEIREYGETSTQVTRRLRAALESLMSSVPRAHRAEVQSQLAKLDTALQKSIADPERRKYASRPDPQGIGGIAARAGNGVAHTAPVPAKTRSDGRQS
jgi:uncharacterized membrane protein